VAVFPTRERPGHCVCCSGQRRCGGPEGDG
jgi:hypothetical protein